MASARSPVAGSGRARPTAATHLPIAPNLLNQEFVAAAPNRVWLADITYIATGEGWLYLAAVLDLATRKIVGWSMRDHMRTELPLAALDDGRAAATTGRRPHLPFRSRQPIRIRGVRQATHCDESETLDEPDGMLLR